MAALKSLWHAFEAAHLAGSPSAAGAAFAAWRARQGPDLELHCRFDAIALHLAATSDPSPWWAWPDGLDVAASAAVDRFAAAHADEVAFLAFLQWLADRQLEAAQARALAAGMRVGLYRDMAIGVVPDGSAAWAHPGAILRGATVGAPPDAFSPLGQNWSVAPLSPLALREQALEPLLADLRAAMRHAGAVRIDHAMGLMRLFWIPAGGTPADGAYVRYPFAEALAAVASESRERGCLVVGEDLGTVPEGFRPPMNEAGILSCKVLWFERWQDGLFKAPDAYDARALATISTHDLSTVRGFFAEVDLAWRERLGLYPDKGQAAQERQRRATAIEQLRGALRYAGLPADMDDPDLIAEALHRYLARTPSWLVGAQLEDLVGETEQPNLPGTIDEHPNWRRRIPLPVEDLAHHPLVRRIIEALRQERPRD
jgi:4-alpha-glucanotransferase